MGVGDAHLYIVYYYRKTEARKKITQIPNLLITKRMQMLENWANLQAQGMPVLGEVPSFIRECQTCNCYGGPEKQVQRS